MHKAKVLCVFSAIFVIIMLFVTACSKKSDKSTDADSEITTTPHRTNVYFIVDGPEGFVAYLPEGPPDGPVHITRIKIQSSISEPYVEVLKNLNSSYGVGVIAWGLGGTLYVKDLEQLKNLILTYK